MTAIERIERSSASSKNNLVICKSNALIQARYRLSLAEHRVILSCISQVRRDEPMSDDRYYTVTAQDFMSVHRVSRQTAYQELKNASDRLFERHVTVSFGPNGLKKPEIRRFRLVQEAVYVPNEATIRLRFSKAILPYLSELKGCFTQYFYEDVSQLRSAYAIRLYEMLVQWRSTRRIQVSIQELREKLQVESDHRMYADFRKNVIERPVQQINESTPLWCQYEPIRTGRRVTHIRFIFGEKTLALEPPDMPQATRKTARRSTDKRITKKEIQAAARPGETEEQVRHRLLNSHWRAPEKIARSRSELTKIKDLLAGMGGGMSEPQ